MAEIELYRKQPKKLRKKPKKFLKISISAFKKIFSPFKEFLAKTPFWEKVQIAVILSGLVILGIFLVVFGANLQTPLFLFLLLALIFLLILIR